MFDRVLASLVDKHSLSGVKASSSAKDMQFSIINELSEALEQREALFNIISYKIALGIGSFRTFASWWLCPDNLQKLVKHYLRESEKYSIFVLRYLILKKLVSIIDIFDKKFTSLSSTEAKECSHIEISPFVIEDFIEYCGPSNSYDPRYKTLHKLQLDNRVSIIRLGLLDLTKKRLQKVAKSTRELNALYEQHFISKDEQSHDYIKSNTHEEIKSACDIIIEIISRSDSLRQTVQTQRVIYQFYDIALRFGFDVIVNYFIQRMSFASLLSPSLGFDLDNTSITIQINNKELINDILASDSDVSLLTLMEYGLNVHGIDGDSFLVAIHMESINVIKLLIKLKFGINKLIDGASPIFTAAANGLLETVKLLCHSGADPTIRRTKDGLSPLHIAIHSGHLKVVEFLCSYENAIEIKCDNGYSPLAYACALKHERTEEVLTLLKANADPNKTRFSGAITPLGVAFALGHNKTIEIILDYGAENNKKVKTYTVPPPSESYHLIHYALSAKNSIILRKLIKYGIDFKLAGDMCINITGKSLISKITDPYLQEIDAGNLNFEDRPFTHVDTKMIDILVRAGVPVNNKDLWLFIAICSQNDFLLRRVFGSKDGSKAIQVRPEHMALACKKGCSQTIFTLLECANIYANLQGDSRAYQIAQSICSTNKEVRFLGDVHLLSILLRDSKIKVSEIKESPELKDNIKRVMSVTKKDCNDLMIRDHYILSMIYDPEKITLCIEELKFNPYVNKPSPRSPFWIACYNGKANVVEKMLQLQPPKDYNDTRFGRISAFYSAASCGYTDVLIVLYRHFKSAISQNELTLAYLAAKFSGFQDTSIYLKSHVNYSRTFNKWKIATFVQASLSSSSVEGKQSNKKDNKKTQNSEAPRSNTLTTDYNLNYSPKKNISHY